jgi:peptide/nickel transport system permease protein
VAGAVLFGVVVAGCWVGPFFTGYSAFDFVASPLLPPSTAHWMGTDTLGRDVLTRVLVGGRVDLVVAVICVVVPLLIGTVTGIAAGMTKHRWADALFVRLVDTVIAFPFVVLVLALVIVFGADRSFGPFPPGVPALLAAIIAVDWTIYARLSRSHVLTLRGKDFVVAAQLLGYSKLRVALRHLFPNVVGTTATYAVSDMVLIVVATASLPFLGAGVQPPTPEWGSIMYEGRSVLASAWWVTVAPGLVLILFGVSVTLMADFLIRARGSE